jgi:hypothetical protein
MMRGRTLLGAALACVALSSSAAAVSHATVRVDHVQVPFYARGIAGDKWAAVIFYRPPSCVPREFNLRTFIDIPRAFGCGPMTMDGYAVFENVPTVDPAPQLSRLNGEGAVPIWFMRTRDFEKAGADGVRTIAELEALEPLRGSARLYSEVFKTEPGRAGSHFSALATGRLANGGAFAYVTLGHYEHGVLINELTVF